MAAVIRLAKHGRGSNYRVVVTDKRNPRDGRFIEILGSYDPLRKDDDSMRVRLNSELIKKWLSVGARPSERVQKLIKKHMS